MADSSNRIIKLNVAPVGTDDSHLYARYPAPFNQMREKSLQALMGLLQGLFDNVDDALFELADRAETNAEQNMFFESMREVRMKRRGMELGFSQGIKQAYREMTGEQLASEQAEPPILDQFAASSLSLVDDAELEELVAVDSMVARACSEFGQTLHQLNTRLDTLISQCTVENGNNPLAPAQVCKAFVEVCKNLELDVKAKLVLFKLFERYVVNNLEEVYQVANQSLIEGGILPNLSQRRQQGSRRGSFANPAASNTRAATEDNSGEDVFATLQTLLHGQQIAANIDMANISAGLAPMGMAPQLPRDNLLQLLQQVQQLHINNLTQHQADVFAGQSMPRQLDVQHVLSQLLARKMPEKPVSIGQHENDAINLVEMLFQFILEDRNLAAPMKALIARLQIPLIKVAMLDNSFFNKNGHPARKLLNEIATAALGWVPGKDPSRDHLYRKVEAVVDRLTNHFEHDISIFSDALADFVAFMEAERRRTRLVEQRTLDAEDGRAKSELARAQVQRSLNEKLSGKTLPKVVVKLIQEGWSNVLFLDYLKHGDQSEQWQQDLQLVDSLLNSVEPSDDSNREQMLAVLPALLKQVRAGLSRIGYNPFEMNQLFEELEQLHTRLLSQPVVKPQPQPSVSLEAAINPDKSLDELLEARRDGETSLEQLEQELDQSFKQLADVMDAATTEQAEIPAASVDSEYIEELVLPGINEEQAESPAAPTLQADDPAYQAVDRLTTGHWIEIHRDKNKKFRCRLAAIIRGTGKYIFVNRSGMKVEEHTRDSLAQAISQQTVTMLDDGQLFDRALESVIGNLRNMKRQTG